MKKSWYKRKGLLTIVFAAVLFAGAIFYVSDYYHSDESVKELMQKSSEASVQKNAGVSVSEISEGLILLAAYPTKELKSDSLSVLSVYGSEDGVLNMEKLEKGRELMPPNHTELCIEGGNHAGFGNYGEQKGDKKAEIDREEQQEQTVEAVLKMAGL